ncbi:hypothetical protein NNC19_08675 [Clostridium sp. SHJSY1]|uniref:hypothetical protein n=1 Tax=Clostridium sp. SHJSY1 TaxID=2942483 RepID=UPI002875377D|nr:hypothetical protein [Clostridium sp. SHJSY1]MDS0525750.1 hypothetical protein [Clostridium sp. SHJSY1]
MEVEEIIDFLEDNDISEIKELKSEEKYSIFNLFYDFDKEELSAAKAYANEESDVEEESDEWYRDWYLSYLYDVAKDNIEEILEDMDEEFGTSSLAKIIVSDASNTEYVKFVVLICNENFEGEIEEILNDYL